MTSTIAASLNELEKLEQIRQHLENCLTKTKQIDQTAELIKFYIELSEVEGISLEKIIDELISINKKSSEIKTLISECWSAKCKRSQIRILIKIYRLFTELVTDHWDYLPPKAIESLKNIKEEIEKSGGTVELSMVHTILLVLTRSSNGENLQKAYKEASLGLANAISEAIEQDIEDALDLEVARAAEQEARREGTIPWEVVKGKYGGNK
ncbi:hypothetical protein BV372_12240 [Nostoc sp. T09]|uniref:hypothetical protein n=1 Tax=Nostoc sp. T09 TaxID=1932621 RepID=UPI000A37E0F6|nr:hypothetical protein [Nostoc sp. T09]OUL35117.1 hypothetical protein BV372_12240 [Nostoc sp. T09]